MIKALERYEARVEPLLEKFAEEPVSPVLFSPNDFATCLEESPPKAKPKIREASFRMMKAKLPGERAEE